MATTFTRLDVEDVLSSIRKLVSDVSPDKAGGGSNGASLFLLTPAHRIAEDTSRMTLSVPADAQAADDQDVGNLHGETGHAGPLHLGTPVFVRAKSADLDPPHEHQVEPDAAPSAPLIIGAAPDELDALSGQENLAEGDTPDQSDDASSEAPAESDEDPFAQAAHHSGSLEMRAAELEIAVSHEDEQWEPDGSEAEPTGFPALAFLAKYRERAKLDPDAPQSEPLGAGEISNFVSEALTDHGVPDETEAETDGAPQTASADAVEPAPEAEPDAQDPLLPEQATPAQVTAENDDAIEVTNAVEQDEDDGSESAETAETAQLVADIQAQVDAEEIAIEALTKVILDAPEKADDQDHDTPGEPLSDAETIDLILKSEPEADDEIAEAPMGEEVPNEFVLDDAQETTQSAAAPLQDRPMPIVIAFEDDEDDDGAFDEPEIWSSDDDLLVDEDVLRRVVADIVRDELQGRLGERITRNVRRMVRREIEKALATRHLE